MNKEDMDLLKDGIGRELSKLIKLFVELNDKERFAIHFSMTPNSYGSSGIHATSLCVYQYLQGEYSHIGERYEHPKLSNSADLEPTTIESLIELQNWLKELHKTLVPEAYE